MITDLQDIKEALRRMEDKLDSYAQLQQANTSDISWIKGYIKTSTAVAIAMVGAAVTYLLQHLGIQKP